MVSDPIEAMLPCQSYWLLPLVIAPVQYTIATFGPFSRGSFGPDMACMIMPKSAIGLLVSILAFLSS